MRRYYVPIDFTEHTTLNALGYGARRIPVRVDGNGHFSVCDVLSRIWAITEMLNKSLRVN